jgi:hypothetical protein
MALFHRYHLNFFILGYFHCLDNLQWEKYTHSFP